MENEILLPVIETINYNLVFGSLIGMYVIFRLMNTCRNAFSNIKE